MESEYELPKSFERCVILVHPPLLVILHSYTNPVFLTSESLRVPLGAPTIRLREKRKRIGEEGGREGGRGGREGGGGGGGGREDKINCGWG